MMNSELARDLRRISFDIARETKAFQISADLLSPSAVYAVESLRDLRNKLDEQLTVIAQHQCNEAESGYSDLEGMA